MLAAICLSMATGNALQAAEDAAAVYGSVVVIGNAGDNSYEFSSFGSGMTLGQAMASGSPAPRLDANDEAQAGAFQVRAPALANLAGVVAGRRGQTAPAMPGGLIIQEYSLAEAMADAMWRRNVVKVLHRRIQAE